MITVAVQAGVSTINIPDHRRLYHPRRIQGPL
jgi:hypothetical protein